MRKPRLLAQLGPQPFTRFWRWWSAELVELFNGLLPSRGNNQVLFEVSRADGIQLADESQQSRLKGKQNLALQFKDNSIQYRKIKLPVAAARNIDKVVRYEFNKYFPMNIDDALIATEVEPAAAGQESISVEIWVISKQLLQRNVATIRDQHELAIGRIALLNSQGDVIMQLPAWQLDSGDQRGTRSLNDRLLNFNIGLLLIALLVYPVYKMDLFIEQLETELDGLQQEAKPVLEIRDGIQQKENRLIDMMRVKQANANQAYIWSEVTRVLSGEVTLDRMEIDGYNVQVEGKTKSVERIIKLLEANKRISNVKIIGAVNTTGSQGEQTLNISMTISPEDGELRS